MSDSTSAAQAVSSAGLYNPYVSSYMSDLDDLDLTYGAYSYPTGMGGSIFSGMPSMYGGITGADNQQYFDNMKQYQNFSNGYYLDQQKMYRNNDLKLNGSMEALKSTAAGLRDKILHNEQDQVMTSYNKYIEAVRNAYGDGTDLEVNSRAATLYQQMTGKTITEDLRENSRSSFTQGFLNGITWGIFNQRSAEDNVADITGQEVLESEKDSQNLGRFLGGLLTGGALLGIVLTIATRGKLKGIRTTSAASGVTGAVSP